MKGIILANGNRYILKYFASYKATHKGEDSAKVFEVRHSNSANFTRRLVVENRQTPASAAHDMTFFKNCHFWHSQNWAFVTEFDIVSVIS